MGWSTLYKDGSHITPQPHAKLQCIPAVKRWALQYLDQQNLVEVTLCQLQGRPLTALHSASWERRVRSGHPQKAGPWPAQAPRRGPGEGAMEGQDDKHRGIRSVDEGVTRCCTALSHVQLFVSTPITGARQAPRSMGFSRQEHWSGLPFPPPGDLPDPGSRTTSLVPPTLAA